MRQADAGIKMLKTSVDSLIVVRNDRLLINLHNNTSIKGAFKIADDVLRRGVQSIFYAIKKNGLVFLDFADIKNLLKDGGLAYMGIGIAKGDGKAKEAVVQGLNSPLLEAGAARAAGVLLHITGAMKINLPKIKRAVEIARQAIKNQTDFKFAVQIDDTLDEEIVAIIIAVGADKTITGL
jgi:cell division protein FtsZ